MSWRDRFTAVGSFRGARFVVPEESFEGGPRVQVHEFPLRDDPQVENLGGKPKTHTIPVFVSGDDYDVDRDALFEALNKPGPGTLVHPWFGRLNVTVTDYRENQSTRSGGRADFTITFVETPVVAALVSDDTQALSEAAADNALTEAANDFADVFDTVGQAADFVQGVVDDVDSVLADVENVVSGISNDITALVRSPFDMATAITGSINNLENSFNSAGDAFEYYRRLFDAGDDSPTVPTTTPSRQQQAANVAAVHRIVQQAAVASACRMSARIDYDSLDDAVATRDVLIAAIDKMINEPVGDALFASLQDLRAAVVRDLRERGMQLPRIQSYTPGATMPALVIAQQLYGDATRADEIVARNTIKHPGFVPAGVPLEVLSDVA